MPAIPAASLPYAPQKVTVVCASEVYDDIIVHALVARDWRSRGEGYLRCAARIGESDIVLAVFDGHLNSLLGSAVPYEIGG